VEDRLREGTVAGLPRLEFMSLTIAERIMAQSKSVVLVTGGSSGIGLELAKIFAAEGHDLIIASDNRGKLKKAADEIALAGDGGTVDIVVADLSKPAGPKKLHDAVQKLGRKVDVLVNNAGRGVWGDFAPRDRP
jgi:hypothetical protein